MGCKVYGYGIWKKKPNEKYWDYVDFVDNKNHADSMSMKLQEEGYEVKIDELTSNITKSVSYGTV